MGVNAIYTMTTIASLLAQSAYVRPRKGASGEGGEEKDELLRHTERQEIPLAGEESRGMFVVRVIWPIKPRGGARSTPRRRSRIDDRRAGERTTRHGGVRVHEREEKRNAVCRPRLGACSAHAWFRLLSCTLPVAVRDEAAATVRDSTAAATRRRTRQHYRFGGPVVLRLACRCSKQAAREKDRRPPPPSPCSSRAPREYSDIKQHHVKPKSSRLIRLMFRNLRLWMLYFSGV